MRTHIKGIWWLAASCFLGAVVVSAQDAPKLESLDQYTRLQLPVTTGTSFRLLRGKAGEATLVVERVSPSALEPLSQFRDDRVERVSVKPAGLDQAEITVRFRDPATESFAYLQGTNLVLDLWKQAGAAKPVAKSESLAPAPTKRTKPRPAPATRAPASAPAEDQAEADVQEAAAPKARIQVEPLRIERDLFQKFVFPMPELVASGKGGGFDLPPKANLTENWKFSEGAKNTDDGKAFELAKRLYQAGKFGLCLKTIEILLRDHPETEHRDELDFLRALAYKKLGESTEAPFLLAKAEAMLQELGAKREEDGQPYPFHRPITLYFAQKEYVAERWLQAIQKLEELGATGKPSDPDFPFIQILLAESYAKVSQPRRAERLYRFIVQNYPKHPLAKEAAYRIADLLAIEKNYQRVDEEGEAALAAYRDQERNRSEVLFHLGEANFWLGRFGKAEKYFRRFVDVASANTRASLGWVRIGEIQEVRDGNLTAARESYLKAKNGYPFSKGDLVATVRLARIDLPTEKDPGFVVKTLREMLTDQTTEWELKRMAELTLVDYLLLTGEVDNALALARNGMAQTDGQVLDLYKRSYVKALFTQLQALTGARKYQEALALYEREKKWIDLYGPESLKACAEIYRGLGLYATANTYMERYVRELRKGRGVASVEGQEALARAKAQNSFTRGAYAETVEALGGLADPASLYMRAVSEQRLGHKRDAYPWADKALAKARARKGVLNDSQLEELAAIQIERNMSERDFARMLKEVDQAIAAAQKESDFLLYARADALWYQKRHQDAAGAYRIALEKFPKSPRAERAQYQRGMSFVSLGRRDDAVKQLTELRETGQGVWAESAKQELELLDWEKKYSSVLKTLPPSGLGIAN